MNSKTGGFLASTVLSTFLSGGACGCSSTSHPIGAVGTDGGGTADDDAGAVVGGSCSTTGDCSNGAALCSNSVFQAGPLFPTAVCMNVGCATATSSEQVDFCGGGTGLCEPGQGTNPSFCFPLCTLAADGTVGGCLGNDACQIQGIATDPNGNLMVIGICQPGCTADGQCPSGSTCDTFEGDCLTTVTPPTGVYGSVCDPTTDTACVCIGAQGGTNGICSSVCVTGSSCPQPATMGDDGGASDGGGDGGSEAGASSAALPFVCSAELGSLGALDAGVSFTTQPTGLDGLCFPSCDTTADCAAYGAAAQCIPDPAGGAHLGICVFPQ